MDQDEQKAAIVSMQRDMHHVLEALKDIKATMATKGELALLATKAEFSALANRVDLLERELREKSPGALWKTATGIAAGIVTFAAAVAILVGLVKP